jgi:hypothetical protein
MTEVSPHEERPAYKPATSFAAPYSSNGPYGETVHYGGYGEGWDEAIDYPITVGELATAKKTKYPMRCIDCDKVIETGGWWRVKGAGEVTVCNACHKRDDDLQQKLLESPLDDVPDSTEIWVSDIADVITHTIVTLLDAVEADHRNTLIEHIRDVIDDYDEKGFRMKNTVRT